MNFTKSSIGKITILILTAHYLPAYKAGGQVKVVAGLVEQLGDEFDFKIITSDRDLRDLQGFSDILVNKWQRVGKADVFYLSPEKKNFLGFWKLINSIKFDVLYLNSFFDPQFTGIPLFLRWLKVIRNTPVIVAPHGEFSTGAIKIKKFKKTCYLIITKYLGLYEMVSLQASNDFEKSDIERGLCLKLNNNTSAPDVIIIAPDIVSEHIMGNNSDNLTAAKIKTDVLKIVFLSRICAKKNLAYALEILNNVKCKVDFDIYGPIDRDRDYWDRCKRIMEKLPKNIRTRYLGPVEPDKVNATFAMYDLFFFPTFGENFGYVIMESLRNGCPVLISDQTPWADFEKNRAGWIIALDKPERFIEIIERLSMVPSHEYQRFYYYAMKYARDNINYKDMLEKNRQMFLNCYKLKRNRKIIV